MGKTIKSGDLGTVLMYVNLAQSSAVFLLSESKALSTHPIHVSLTPEDSHYPSILFEYM